MNGIDGDVHTVHSEGSWINEVEGRGIVGATHARKEDAVVAGRDSSASNRSDHLIHDMDGTIVERSSYRHPRYPPSG